MNAAKNPANEMMEKAQADFANMSESFRNMAEKGVAQSTEAYSQFKTMAEDATSAAQQSFDAMREGMTVLSAKAMDNAKANAEAGMAFVEKVSKVKTFAEVLELQGEFFRASFERLSSQAKETQELAMKVSEKAAAPVKASAEKATAAVAKEANKAMKSAKAA
ncbi:MAG: TIGR01841 family phasin [Nitratireductor sp.]|nr:TIGR01841 family phasin [Nitratireductor sp.]